MGLAIAARYRPSTRDPGHSVFVFVALLSRIRAHESSESILAEDITPASHKVVLSVYPTGPYLIGEWTGKSTQPRYDGDLQRVCGYNRRASQTQGPEQGGCTKMLFCFLGMVKRLILGLTGPRRRNRIGTLAWGSDILQRCIHLPRRLPASCRERWLSFLAPDWLLHSTTGPVGHRRTGRPP